MLGLILAAVGYARRGEEPVAEDAGEVVELNVGGGGIVALGIENAS